MADIPLITPPTDPPARPRRRRKLSPLVVNARGLMRLLGCKLRTVRTWNAAGKLPAPIRLGGCVVWRIAEIKEWLAAGAPDRPRWQAIRAARK